MGNARGSKKIVFDKRGAPEDAAAATCPVSAVYIWRQGLAAERERGQPAHESSVPRAARIAPAVSDKDAMDWVTNLPSFQRPQSAVPSGMVSVPLP